MVKNKTFSCIIFENRLTILSFDDKIIGRTQESLSFYHSISLTILVLLDGVCGDVVGLGGGIGVGIGISGVDGSIVVLVVVLWCWW